MTRRNFFGETIHGPEDTPGDFQTFAGELGAGGFYAARISDDGNEDFKWCASVDMNEVSGELNITGFEDEATLRAWLIEAGVPAGEIEVES